MSRLRAVVVADDLTGAAECQAQLWPRLSTRTRLADTVLEPRALESDCRLADVLVLDSEARSLANQAAQQIDDILSRILRIRAVVPQPIYLKVDSTLRGDIGQYIATACRRLKARCVPVVLANPAEGRLTRNGLHFLGETLIERTSFANDPTHPILDSRISTLFDRNGSHVDVSHVSLTELRSSQRSILQRLRAEPDTPIALVFDAVSSDDLARIARLIEQARSRLICGSGGLIGHLHFGKSTNTARPQSWLATARLPERILIACGSLNPIATAQLDGLHSAVGAPVLTLASGRTPAEAGKRLAELLELEPIVIVMSERQTLPSSISGDEDVSWQVAEAVRSADDNVRIDALVLIGGRTAYHVCRKLGITAFEIKDLLAPNLPLCFTLDSLPRLLVLKPGGFGDADLLARSLRPLLR